MGITEQCKSYAPKWCYNPLQEFLNLFYIYLVLSERRCKLVPFSLFKLLKKAKLQSCDTLPEWDQPDVAIPTCTITAIRIHSAMPGAGGPWLEPYASRSNSASARTAAAGQLLLKYD